MRVYFTANNQAKEKLQKRFSSIISALSNAGVMVMSNLANQHLSGFSSNDIERLDQSGEALLEKMDGLIIEGTQPFDESAYLVAIALAHKKPILYLSEKGKLINKNLIHLQKEKSAGQVLFLQYYTDDNLEKIVQDFLLKVEKGEGREVPNIKFTLRITSRIERYLYWKTHNTKMSKADFLRNLIEQVIDEDESYLKFINRQKDN